MQWIVAPFVWVVLSNRRACHVWGAVVCVLGWPVQVHHERLGVLRLVGWFTLESAVAMWSGLWSWR